MCDAEERCGGDSLEGHVPSDEEKSLVKYQAGEEEAENEIQDILNHGYRSDLKWSMKDYRPPKYRYVRYRSVKT